VDDRKRRALRQAIARWVNRYRYEGAGRIDVICVAGGVVIEHLLDLGADFY
jgi:Holliday junction resolvase-like predicted endonuclease